MMMGEMLMSKGKMIASRLEPGKVLCIQFDLVSMIRCDSKFSTDTRHKGSHILLVNIENMRIQQQSADRILSKCWGFFLI